MRGYNVYDVDVFDDMESYRDDLTDEQKKYKKLFRYVKLLIFSIMGPGALRATYRPSEAKERNTDYLNRF